MLIDRLRLGPIADGRYFIDRIAASVGATTTSPAKRGPSKSPDFVALDTSGFWHIIECKGTQSGTPYRNRQLGNPGPPPTGAVAQKRTITFPLGYTGQRLACGLFIGVEGGYNESNLRIIDPPAEDSFVIEENHIAYAVDAIGRSTGARALRLAGFGAASSALSAPSGTRPDSRPTTGHAENVRREVVAEKTARAREELENRQQHETFQVAAERYRGRSVEIDLPTPIGFGGLSTQRVRLRYGVNENFLDELARRPLLEEPQTKADAGWHQMIGGIMIESEHTSASMQMGSLFVTEIEVVV